MRVKARGGEETVRPAKTVRCDGRETRRAAERESDLVWPPSLAAHAARKGSRHLLARPGGSRRPG